MAFNSGVIRVQGSRIEGIGLLPRYEQQRQQVAAAKMTLHVAHVEAVSSQAQQEQAAGCSSTTVATTTTYHHPHYQKQQKPRFLNIIAPRRRYGCMIHDIQLKSFRTETGRRSPVNRRATEHRQTATSTPGPLDYSGHVDIFPSQSYMDYTAVSRVYLFLLCRFERDKILEQAEVACLRAGCGFTRV